MDKKDDKLTNSRDVVRSVFILVCNIPYGGVGIREVQSAVKKNSGSCSSKHQLLYEILTCMNLKVRKMMGECDLCQFGKTLTPPIMVDGRVRDFHNFLEVKIEGKWTVIDATFGLHEEKLGLISNLNWDGYSDCLLTFPTRNILEVDDIFREKNKAVNSLPRNEQKCRHDFFSSFCERITVNFP